MKELIIGSHVNVNAPDMLLGAVKDALSYNANTFMFYTGAPQNTVRKDISTFKVEEAKKLMKDNNIDINNIIVHAPYIINLANVKDEEKFPVVFLKNEINRVSQIGCKYLVLHPGSHVGKGEETGIKEIIDNLNDVLDNDNSNVVILLETMAGKGTELGKNFDQICALIKGIHKQNKIGVCMDTCHIHDGGYDLQDFDKILDEFDSKIGLDKLKVIHINDSKNPKGAAKDRHENFGFGEIGFEKLINVIYNERVADTIKILETPWVEDFPPYKEEIEMIRNKKFDPLMKEKIISKNKK